MENEHGREKRAEFQYQLSPITNYKIILSKITAEKHNFVKLVYTCTSISEYDCASDCSVEAGSIGYGPDISNFLQTVHT